LLLDLSDLRGIREIATIFAGNGIATVQVPEGARLTITSHTPIEGVYGGEGRYNGDVYIYERPGRGPHILMEGYGPLIRVE
jgi:hypothetical protein